MAARPSGCPVLSWKQRGALIALGSGLLVLQVTAVVLPPDPRGFGTHQRLGLPPCSFLQLTGVRCPSCGMTTAWSHLARGRLVQALRANAGGTLLGLVCLAIGPWSLISGLRGRWLVRPLGQLGILVVLLSVIATTTVDWLLRWGWSG